jgi:hypothetical protein
MLFMCAVGENAVEDWEPIIELAKSIIKAEPANPLPHVGLGAALYLAGRPSDAVKELTAIMPQHTLAILIAPDKKNAILQSHLMGETYLALSYRDLGKRDEAEQARKRAQLIISRMEKDSEVFDELQVLWGSRYATYISRRKLTLFFDARPAQAESLAPRATGSSSR